MLLPFTSRLGSLSGSVQRPPRVGTGPNLADKRKIAPIFRPGLSVLLNYCEPDLESVSHGDANGILIESTRLRVRNVYRQVLASHALLEAGTDAVSGDSNSTPLSSGQ